MEEGFSGNSKTETIEDLELRLETDTHLASLVVTEEVCVFVCSIFLSRSQTWANLYS